LITTIVSLGVVIFLIKKMYNLEWEKTIVVWLLWLVGSLITGFLIGVVVAIFFAGALAA